MGFVSISKRLTRVSQSELVFIAMVNWSLVESDVQYGTVRLHLVWIGQHPIPENPVGHLKVVQAEQQNPLEVHLFNSVIMSSR